MNSQGLGEPASGQKNDKVFHAYGYSIPVADKVRAGNGATYNI